jgi:hypothetical protein
VPSRIRFRALIAIQGTAIAMQIAPITRRPSTNRSTMPTTRRNVFSERK